jgi:hypothetical protein
VFRREGGDDATILDGGGMPDGYEGLAGGSEPRNWSWVRLGRLC